MALMGVLLGIFGRVAADNGSFAYLGFSSVSSMDPEMGLPMLLRTILPVGLMGVMMSAYFSAIMSTADSCLMAASGNVVSDLYDKIFPVGSNHKKFLRVSQIATLLIGLFALFIATTMQNVLQLMLYSYAFMVSGLFVPLIAALFFNKRNSTAAMTSMLLGGFTTITLIIIKIPLPLGLDPNIFGITTSALAFIIISGISSTEKFELLEEGE
jgi:SSS family solute:Na+ symporter